MAMIVDAYVSRFINFLGKLVEEEVGLFFGVPGEIEKLRCTLCTMKEFLADAERKRINNASIDQWVKDLKDVMYDADDILDRCQIEWENGGEKCSNSSPSTTWKQFLRRLLTCCHKAAVTHEIGSRIKELNERLKGLEEILMKKSQFHLMLNSLQDCQKTSQISRQTSPLTEPNIVGSKIEEDTESLVKLLTTQDMRTNVLVFAITGLGGVGKTTLAQKIFNEQRIEDSFQKKMWVCVSQEFSEIELLKEIITAIGGVPGGAKSRSQLEPLVKEQLNGKKFLLILDDVWKIEVWNDLLRKPLQNGAAGSRVIITTRIEQVAMQMKAVYNHHVKKLSPEDGWALLCKEVVLNGEDREIESLKDIGMEIVRKCDGLPLAIKTIGGVLCMKNRTRNAWEGVIHNTAWSITGLPEEVQVALYLSYEDLPTHLKQYFLYCSLFPEDRTIDSFHLICLWICEGFVEVHGNLSMEDVGKEYYEELMMRNLLIPDTKVYEQGACKMHDLLRSLAQFLTRDESTTFQNMEGINNNMGLIKLRRVSITDKEVKEAPCDLTKQESVRTLILCGSPISSIDNLIHKLSRLRVLDLQFSSVTSLPDSLGHLVHLRFLDLAHSKITVIPETIGSLKNLLYLNFRACESLVSLPNSIVNLQSLRGFHIPRTLDGLPSGLGRLHHLCYLSGFVLPENNAEGCSTLEEVGNLSQLKRLGLERLERVSSSSEAKGAALLDKTKLARLELRCTPQHTEEEIKKIQEVFEELRPPPSLIYFIIEGYSALQFPTWMTAVTSSSVSNLSNLRYLCLKGCRNCKQLPPLGLLSNLDYLEIDRAESVTSIGHEFLEGGSSVDRNASVSMSNHFFPRLEELTFERMFNWEEWVWENGVQAMPCLTHLELFFCPKLRSLPEGLQCHATALTVMFITACNNLRAVENILSLEKLELELNPRLVRLSNLPSLRVLVVKQHCPALQVMENLGELRRMELDDSKLETLPEYLSEGVLTAELKSLVIKCSEPLLRKICLTDGSLEWPKIKHFQHVSVYSPSKTLYAHYRKTPFSFITNRSAPTISSLTSSTS